MGDCKVLFHTVGPYWNGGSKNEESQLTSVVQNCLKEADSIGIQSIALPAVSTGQYKYPTEKCAQTMLKATKSYIQSNESSSLNLIRFVLFDQATCNIFSTEGEKIFN